MSTTGTVKAILSAGAATALACALAACEGTPTGVEPPDRLSADAPLRAMGRVDVCHRTDKYDRPFVRITIADAAYETHVAHGDGVVGGTVPGPGMDGFLFGEDCELVEVGPDPAAFVTTWDTRLGPGTTVALPLFGTVDVSVDWGDGTVEEIQAAGAAFHEYEVEGIYTVSITGTVTRYGLPHGTHSSGGMLVSVDSWGQLGFETMHSAFRGAVNLTSVPSTTEGLENVTDMSFMFHQAWSFNHPIGDWNTENVTNMTGMFWDARVFNQDLSGWCVELISSHPSEFDSGTGSWELEEHRPVWGTCPGSD